MVLRAPVSMSVAAYDVLWTKLELGDKPTPLFVPSPGATRAERAAIETEAALELHRIGLADTRGVHPDLQAAARLLARAPQEFYGWVVRSDGTTIGAMVASDDTHAVLAVLDGELLRLYPARPDSAAAALAAQLPPAPAAHGASLTVPETEYRASTTTAQPRPSRRHTPDEDEGFTGLASAAPGKEPAVRQLTRLLAEPANGKGQFFVAVRDRTGRRHRSPFPLDYLDTTGGRWYFHIAPNNTGQNWITAAPGSPEAITRTLHDMHQHLLRGVS